MSDIDTLDDAPTRDALDAMDGVVQHPDHISFTEAEIGLPLLSQLSNPCTESEAVSTPEPPTYDDEHVGGNFTIISADNVVFRVPSFFVQSHSTVLRDALATGDDSAKVLALSDPSFEDAGTVRAFLDAITRGGRPEQADHHLRLVRRLLKFADKYECAMLVCQLTSAIAYSMTTGHTKPHKGFEVGAGLGNVELCVTALKTAKSWKYDLKNAAESDSDDSDDSADEADPEAAKTFVAGMSILDPSAMPLGEHRRIPPDYLWALSRAWRQARAATRDPAGEVVAKAFADNMRIIQEFGLRKASG